jgi:hypothetical protein
MPELDEHQARRTGCSDACSASQGEAGVGVDRSARSALGQRESSEPSAQALSLWASARLLNTASGSAPVSSPRLWCSRVRPCGRDGLLDLRLGGCGRRGEFVELPVERAGRLLVGPRTIDPPVPFLAGGLGSLYELHVRRTGQLVAPQPAAGIGPATARKACVGLRIAASRHAEAVFGRTRIFRLASSTPVTSQTAAVRVMPASSSSQAGPASPTRVLAMPSSRA